MASLIRRAGRTARLTALAPMEARFPFRSPEAIERAQRRRIAATVAHAHRHVPYYRETMRRLGIGPGEITTAAALAKLPLIHREQLQRDPEYFVSDAAPLDSHIDLRTGGSTGEPILFLRDVASALHRVLAFQRHEPTLRRLTGRRFRRRMVLIAPPSSSTASVNAATRSRLLHPGVHAVRRTFSVFDPPERVAREIDRFRPDVITGYGSCIEALFAGPDGAGPMHNPRVVVYAADPLSEPTRALLAERGIETLSVYQAVETPTIGWECERHRGHHLNVDLCPLRVLDDDLRELPAGESGQIAVSNLENRGTVLLNYLLGDLATRLPDPCDCGRNLPLLSWVEGRSTDWLVTGSGGRLHPQAIRAFLRFIPGVRRYQIVQERPGSVRVAIVAAPDADRDEIRSRVAAGAVDLAEPFAAEAEFIDDLPRTEGGKVRVLVGGGGSPAPSGSGTGAGSPA